MATVGALIARLQRYAEHHEGLGSDDGVVLEAGDLSSAELAEAAQAVADELVALQAIYGDDSVALLTVQRTRSGSIQMTVIDDDAAGQLSDAVVDSWDARRQQIRLALRVELHTSEAATASSFPTQQQQPDAAVDIDGSVSSITMRLSAILPIGYPMAHAPPQLQLLSRYIGVHGVDHALFGQILRIFIASGDTDKDELPPQLGKQKIAEMCADRVRFEQGQVVLFDGIEKARELVERWYEEREANQKAQQSNTHTQRSESKGTTASSSVLAASMATLHVDESRQQQSARPSSSAVKLITAPAITERKSTFVGHAAPLYSPNDVADILTGLLQDRRVARATHPAMYAWVCRTSHDGIVHRDCDDDGEQAAGGRLAHLLDVLHVQNAIVIVTRWYGGVLLGPDRFKLINRAARDALELASIIDGPLNPTTTAAAQAKGRKN